MTSPLACNRALAMHRRHLAGEASRARADDRLPRRGRRRLRVHCLPDPGPAAMTARQRHGQPRWEGRCYRRTREGLLLRVHELAGPIEDNALDILRNLRIGTRHAQPDGDAT